MHFCPAPLLPVPARSVWTFHVERGKSYTAYVEVVAAAIHRRQGAMYYLHAPRRHVHIYLYAYMPGL